MFARPLSSPSDQFKVTEVPLAGEAESVTGAAGAPPPLIETSLKTSVLLKALLWGRIGEPDIDLGVHRDRRRADHRPIDAIGRDVAG